MAHFGQGALDAKRRFVDPTVALRRTDYMCPDCGRAVRVKRGDTVVAHFAHKPDSSNPCNYYDKCASLDQRHTNAELKLKQFLERGTEVEIYRKCACGCRKLDTCGIRCLPGNVVKREYSFVFKESTKRADVALLDTDGGLRYIFEVVNKHYTKEGDRPDPWYEIHADEINAIPSTTETIGLTCLRQVMHPECLAREEANQRALDERRARWEAERRARDAAQEEANRRRQEEFDRQERERQAKWERAMNARAEEEERLRQNDERHRDTVVVRRIDGERPHLTAVEQQRTQRHQQQMGVEEDQLRWDAVHPRHSELYKEYARDVSACMLCSTGFRWEESASLGRCQICSASIRKRVEQRLSPSHAHTLSE